MKITIVVRTYNRPHFLKECLASIELQTHIDWEVLIFDDMAMIESFKIYKKFKEINLDKRIVYLTSATAYDMFKESWLLAPDLAKGEIMVRLDDDDLLTEDSLSYISDLYQNNSDLDFTYGSSVTFDNDNGKLLYVTNTSTPLEVPATTTAWAGYLIPNNHPWREPNCWYSNYYNTPQYYTSIIHCSKYNILCIFHLYTMRTDSIKKIKNKITITSKFVDDLEFLGSLDYIGLGHTSIHHILLYLRSHNKGKQTDIGKITDGTTLWDNIIEIRDKVEYLRPSGFNSRIVKINAVDNFNNDITNELETIFIEFHNKIKIKSLQY